MLTTSSPAWAQLDPDSPWPKFQHNVRNTGQSPLNGPSTANVKVKWSYKFGSRIRTSPAIGSDGTVYIGVGGNPMCAINPDGTKKWCTSLPGVNVSPLMSSPAIDVDGRIYMGARDNDTWAVSPAGEVLWRFSIPWDGDSTSSPTIDSEGRIYAGCGCVGNGTLYAITTAGQEAWDFKVGDSLHGSTPAIGSDGTIYTISGPGRLSALTPGTNSATRKWGPFFSGKQAKYASPVLGADDTIYVPSLSGIRAFAPGNGALLWTFPTEGRVNSTPGVRASDGTIFFGTTKGCFYAVNADGTQKWKNCDLTGKFLSGTAIGANGIAYSATTEGWVYAFNPANGSIVWQFQIGKVQFSAPAIGPDRTLYIGSHDHTLYAFEED
jgi:outer membrane protein assembly factor BamB